MIIRGIGYRVFYVALDLVEAPQVTAFTSATYACGGASITDVGMAQHEFPFSRYVIIRAGHTKDLYQPLSQTISVKTSKKDRKLSVSGENRAEVNYLAGAISKYRAPSAYTGRGIRTKHVKPIRKVGKKDKQKGKTF